MALSDENTQLVYLACGLWAGGGTRYRYRFNSFSMADVETTSVSWDYDSVKTVVDTALAALNDAQETLLETWCATFKTGLDSEFSMDGGSQGVHLSDGEAAAKARASICQLVGIEVEAVPFAEDLHRGGLQGRVVR